MSRLIEHVDELERYAPPGHSGTANVRLVGKEFCGAFEMIRGVLQPGGEAEPHEHAEEHQVIYVIGGTAEVELGDAPTRQCGPGTVVRIPPGLRHRVVALGAEPLELIVLYSPPLKPRKEFPLD